MGIKRRPGRVLPAEPEGQWFDRKSSRGLPRDPAIPLISFANADRGVPAIGLHDGKREGIGDDRRLLNKRLQAGREHAWPAVPFPATELVRVNSAGMRDRVLLLDIPASSRVHATRRTTSIAGWGTALAASATALASPVAGT